MTEIYVIRSGDTLSKLAAQFGVSLNELLAINPQIDDADLIFAGQPINVPSIGDSAGSGTTDSADDGEASWYNIAEAELGTKEIPGSQHNPRIVEYHATTSLAATNDETPWCSSFVNWCVQQAGIEGTNSAAARSWIRWGKKLSTPRKGCIVVYSSSRGPTSGHVGFFEGFRGNQILTLGGNQSNTVNFASYPSSRLLGYRWPS